MNKNKLNILWTNSNINTSKYMALMYPAVSKRQKWYDEVEVIIWGDTARLSAENAEIQESIKKGIECGVKFTACKYCADELGATPKLEEMGVEVIYMGEPLTEIIKSGEHLITV